MKKPLFTLSAVVLNFALFSPVQVIAMPNFQASDNNHAGQAPSAEAQANMAALFAKIDSNSDGFITLTESNTWQESAGLEHFTQLDSDSNSALSLTEFQAGAPNHGNSDIAARLFNLLDNDKNSALSWDEFGVMEPSKGENLRHFSEMDSDGDSQVSQAEFLAQRPPRHPGPPQGASSSTSTQTG